MHRSLVLATTCAWAERTDKTAGTSRRTAASCRLARVIGDDVIRIPQRSSAPHRSIASSGQIDACRWRIGKGRSCSVSHEGTRVVDSYFALLLKDTCKQKDDDEGSCPRLG